MALAANLVVKLVFWVIGFYLLAKSVPISGANVNERLNIWPMPKLVSHGHHSLYLGSDFELKTDGSSYLDVSGVLKDGFFRTLDVIRGAHVIDANISPLNPSRVLKGIHVDVCSPSDEAQTVYGALHGLQTFSQLCYFNFTTKAVEVRQVPWTILDQPRFSYRGLLIDTARHFLPLPVIKKVIDSMAYSKLNVLHWHIVDTQSFPLELPSFPKLWDGAYSTSERYTTSDATEIVRYAQRRGINVLAEIDVPGHAQSWGVGYPSLWPSRDCQQPLDVSNEFTFKVIDGILSDFSKIFKYRFIHLGGDEVNTNEGWNY